MGGKAEASRACATVMVAGFPAVVTAGLGALVTDDPNLALTASVQALDELPSYLSRWPTPNVLVLDGSALARPRDLREVVGRAYAGAVLVLAPSLSPALGSALLAHGASACLPLESPVSDVLACIRLVARGAYLWLGERQAAHKPRPDLDLTPREAEVYELICKGKSNAQIAQTLSISPHTAHTHVSRILKKAGVHSRRDLIWQRERGSQIVTP